MGASGDRYLSSDNEDSRSDDESEEEAPDHGNGNNEPPAMTTHIQVRTLKMKDFRNRLIRHFDIAYQKKEINWPKARMKNTEAPNI